MSARGLGRALCSALLLAGCGGPPPLLACEPHDGTTPVCGFQNPEDIAVLPGGEWLVVSQSPRGDAPGGLLGFRPGDGARRPLWDGAAEPASPSRAACPGPLDPVEAMPHGIDVTPDGKTLLLVSHDFREAIEIFDIRDTSDGPVLVWTDCVPMPERAMMNDVAALPDGTGFVVTRMTSMGLDMLALLFKRNSGRVYEWSEAEGLREIPNTEGAGPNGVEVSPDGNTVYFAEWGAERLIRIARDGSGRSAVPLGFGPDNLTWTPDGQLLVGGQFAAPLDVLSCFPLEEGTCAIASAAASYDPASGTLERIWSHDPARATGAISVALEHDDRVWLGSFAGDRLAWIPAR